MSFFRKFSAIESLKNEPLFVNYLLDDIKTGKQRGRQKENSFVFPAVRDERIDFYWGGGKLFSYKPKTGFETHHKYASVMVGNAGDYISESALQNGEFRLIQNFCEGYERIKENCERYSGLEALGVSSLYERFSCAKSEASSVVILDIEASFAKEDSQEKDRIDIVSLDTENRTIRFVEAKHYSNNASLRTSSGKPAVYTQMKRYAEQIQQKSAAILDAYRSHVQVINALFSVKIAEPVAIDPEPILLIFGFDNEQRGYLKKEILAPMKDDGLRVYSIGEIKKSELSVVFRGGKENW
ncbi:MAG: hypothetical protein DELT_02588 [Desulfovibrio sp.]